MHSFYSSHFAGGQELYLLLPFQRWGNEGNTSKVTEGLSGKDEASA